MNPIVQQITEKTGMSQAHATTAVETVLGFLKKKMPAPMASQLDQWVSEEGGEGGAQQQQGQQGQQGGGMASQIGEMMGKK